jgi:hypothetical protein
LATALSMSPQSVSNLTRTKAGLRPCGLNQAPSGNCSRCLSWIFNRIAPRLPAA